jgi:hypothetical protein
LGVYGASIFSVKDKTNIKESSLLGLKTQKTSFPLTTGVKTYTLTSTFLSPRINLMAIPLFGVDLRTQEDKLL